MDTAEALKRAMQALRDADIPEALWDTALPLALADIRGGATVAPGDTDTDGATRRKTAPKKARAASRSSRRDSGDSESPDVLVGLPDEKNLFKAITAETGVAEADLADLFHVESGKVQIKVPGSRLGPNTKAATMTIAALLGGLTFAGTEHRKLPFREINEYLKAKNVFHEKNASTYIKATPGFASVSAGRALFLTTKTGWADEFAKAAGRALGKPTEG